MPGGVKGKDAGDLRYALRNLAAAGMEPDVIDLQPNQPSTGKRDVDRDVKEGA